MINLFLTCKKDVIKSKNGEWGMDNEEWGMENGNRNGDWRMEDLEWGIGEGKWRMRNGEWRMKLERKLKLGCQFAACGNSGGFLPNWREQNERHLKCQVEGAYICR